MGCFAKAAGSSPDADSTRRSNWTTTESGLGEVVRNCRKAAKTEWDTDTRRRPRLRAAAVGSRNSMLGGSSAASDCDVFVKGQVAAGGRPTSVASAVLFISRRPKTYPWNWPQARAK